MVRIVAKVEKKRATTTPYFWYNSSRGETMPYYCMDFEEILRYDVDRWSTINTFIKPLVEKKLGDKQIIEQIATRFNCSYTTAWRRLRHYKTGSV